MLVAEQVTKDIATILIADFNAFYELQLRLTGSKSLYWAQMRHVPKQHLFGDLQSAGIFTDPMAFQLTSLHAGNSFHSSSNICRHIMQGNLQKQPNNFCSDVVR